MSRLAILVLMLFLAGCCPRETDSLPRIVTKAEVTSIQDGKLERYTYTDPQKLEALLYYLRSAAPSASDPISPETFRTDVYEIRLTLISGEESVYRQIYDRYLQKGNGPWRHISSTHGSTLQSLLHELPSDV